MVNDMTRFNIDFSLAMHNWTGKYVIGKDLIDTPGLPIAKVYYWRAPRYPNIIRRKLYGRVQLWQVKARTGTARGIERLGAVLRRRKSRYPILHIDPLTVPTWELRRKDIVLCHDVGPITHPHLFARDVGSMYSAIYREVATVGPHMVFVSHESQDLFERLYPSAQLASSRVIYPAIREITQGDSGQAIEVDSPFLLTVGSIGARKNQVRCIEAFERSGLAALGVTYVLCGALEPGHEAVASAADATRNVLCLPYVSSATLSWLYGNASGFVLVSQLEGFGMPVAEAICHGLVPLVTKNSVLEEVAGTSALSAPAHDIEAIGVGMRRLVTMESDERDERLKGLRDSVRRFDVIRIQGEWRAAFDEWSVSRDDHSGSKG